MRYLIALWAFPLILFWGWYFLSYYDINFGYVMFSRVAHDFVFELYGNILGIDPSTIPPLVARACVFDTFILLAILAFRRRRQLMARFRQWRAATAEKRQPEHEAGLVHPAE